MKKEKRIQSDRLKNRLGYLLLFLIVLILPINLYSQTDSLNHKQQDKNDVVIESLKIPVRVKDQIVFYLYSGYQHLDIHERAMLIEYRIQKILQQDQLIPDSLRIVFKEGNYFIDYKSELIVVITDEDSLALKKGKKEITEEYYTSLKNAMFPLMSKINLKKTTLSILKIAFFILIILFITVALIKLLNKLLNKLNVYLYSFHRKHSEGISIKGLKFLTAQQIEKILIITVKLIRFVMFLIIYYNSIYFILLSIPSTQGVARQLQAYISKPFVIIGKSFINYLPSLFFILAIVLIARFCLKFLRYLFDEIENGNIKFKNFYPDWSDSTYQIAKFLLFFFVAIIIFPYLPGSNSPAFKGISIFVGVLFSLGSSSAISNIIAGIMLTYMRSFKIGDIIKIGETTGELIETSLFVIRIRTMKNVEITIPNSIVLNGHIYDYTKYAEEQNLVLHTKVTIGYDVPWRLIHELLIRSAKQTEGILSSKEPFVLQTALNDSYVEYEINAYTDRAAMMPKIYSELHKNIQDQFVNAGVEIMSPLYHAIRDGNETTIPKS